MRRTNRTSAFSGPKSPVRRFLRDESGQGIIFAAATMLILVGFVMFVFNIGRVVEGRTKIQLGADAAVYSGAVVQANSLSAIAWLNSAMSQIYYNSLKTAVDVDVAAVAAELDRRLYPDTYQSMQAYGVYQIAYNNANDSQTGLPGLKQWMLDLSRIENSIAILTPRLVDEEMFTVAGRAGAQRMSTYPGSRMYPSGDSVDQWRIERFGDPNGWGITHLTGGKGPTSLKILLQPGNVWDLEYSDNNGTVLQQVLISQESPTRWRLQYFQPPGHLVQEMYLEQQPDLGWVVWGSQPDPRGGPPIPTPSISFTPVDMDGDGFKEGTRITQGGTSQVLKRGSDGNMYIWGGGSYVKLTASQTTVGGVNVQVNVTNVIKFPGASARIGDPTVVDIGGAHIVLTNPPNISCGMGPVRISVWGFDNKSFGVSVGDFNLTPGDSDGRWRNYYNPREELWWRQRLVVTQLDLGGKPNRWEYDRESLGALLKYEAPWNDLLRRHAFNGRGFGTDPTQWPMNQGCSWTAWFESDLNTPAADGPKNLAWQPQDSDFDAPDAHGIRHLLAGHEPPEGAYYQTSPKNSTLGCPKCNGTGKMPDGSVCPVCHAWDNYGDSDHTNVRVSIRSLADSPQWPAGFRHDVAGFPGPANASDANLAHNDYLDARIFKVSYNVPAPMMPLILSEDFFKWGLNIAVWKAPDNLVLFPPTNTRNPNHQLQPAWGAVALSSARVGFPNGAGGYVYSFNGDKGARANFCNSLLNLYNADVQPRLFSTKTQVNSADLDTDILADSPDAAYYAKSNGQIDESGLSLLWDAILSPHTNWNNQANWVDRFNGQPDPSVAGKVNDIRDRQNRRFDYGSSNMDKVVEH